MPSMELFARQPESYRTQVLPNGVKKLSIEAASPESWYRWVGSDGIVMGIDRFGASAPYEKIYEELGLTVDKIVASVKEMV
jgi:transketolase